MKRRSRIQNNIVGFTLAELLIVVAIIGVLTVIAIPVFTTQLEKSRESVDLSHVRSAYAELANHALTGGSEAIKTESCGAYYIDVTLKQSRNDWQMALPIHIGNIRSTDTAHWLGTPRANGTCRVKMINNEFFLEWSGQTLAAMEGVNTRPGIFWQRQDKKIYSDGTTGKNSVDAVKLNKGDTFVISKSCFAANTNKENRILAFYLINSDLATEYNDYIVDSGWLDKKDLEEFTPGAGKYGVDHPEDYYTIETVDNGLKFTIKSEDGLTLLINNTVGGQLGTLMNGVFVDRAD